MRIADVDAQLADLARAKQDVSAERRQMLMAEIDKLLDLRLLLMPDDSR